MTEIFDRSGTLAAGADSVGRIALAGAARHHGYALTRPDAAPISYQELARAATEIAGGLAALGVEPGERVAILAGTRPEWTLADFGALCAGAAVVPIYHTNSPKECAYVLAHSEAGVAFCENAGQLAKVERVRAGCPALRHVVLMEGEADGTVSMAALRELGRASGPAVAEERLAAVGPDDVATIVYTSGTTGPPKGCRLTHANLLAAAAMYEQRLDLRGAIVYLYLPLAHSLARVTQLVTLDVGGTLAFWGGDPQRIVAELAEIRPTHFPTVPRVLEKIHSGVVAAVEEGGALRRAVFRWGLAEGRRASARRRAGAGAGPLARARERVADRLVLSRVREVFGDRLRLGLTGAAPIGRELLEFFDACGIVVLEGYGMTETSAAATLNTERELRFGSVGRPLPGADVATAPDGEVLLRGPHVFAGYHRDPEATRAVLDGGWLRSGDLGALDDEGFLHITGRKKDLIITSSGKNISPESLESALRETRWIANAIVYGDRRPYLVALIALDSDELPALAAELGVSADPAAMATDERVHAAVARDVEAVNARFARIEQIKRFAILERDLSQAAGELTPTLKVKRTVLCSRYADRFESLYAGVAAVGARPRAPEPGRKRT
ncbi:MAG TPA: long-chain fatty acid--CoA ligase [Solirubrobacteraceae bacterium]